MVQPIGKTRKIYAQLLGTTMADRRLLETNKISCLVRSDADANKHSNVLRNIYLPKNTKIQRGDSLFLGGSATTTYTKHVSIKSSS